MTILNQPITLIEADVVIVLTNKSHNRLEVHSLWECELSSKAVRVHALHLGQKFNEACGGGYVEIDIHDFRDPMIFEKPIHLSEPDANILANLS